MKIDDNTEYIPNKPRIIIFGECHTHRVWISEKFHAHLSPKFNIMDLSHGPGNNEFMLTLLNIKEFLQNDIFFIGGCGQERLIDTASYTSKTSKLINIILTKYKNAKIIFFNIPCASTFKRFQSRQEIIAIRNTFVNNQNIFSYNVNSIDSDYTDERHFHQNKMNIIVDELIQFIELNFDKLLTNKYQHVDPNQRIFNVNKQVMFILKYINKLEQNTPLLISFEDHRGIKTEKNLIKGVQTLYTDRPDILIVPNLKQIQFHKDILVTECQVENY